LRVPSVPRSLRWRVAVFVCEAIRGASAISGLPCPFRCIPPPTPPPPLLTLHRAYAAVERRVGAEAAPRRSRNIIFKVGGGAVSKWDEKKQTGRARPAAKDCGSGRRQGERIHARTHTHTHTHTAELREPAQRRRARANPRRATHGGAPAP
jgi:hypothetical protein